jgi:mRNA interferase MazF
MVGEIYPAKIYFTDLSYYKIRPVLVIKTLGDDCMCLHNVLSKKEKKQSCIC